MPRASRTATKAEETEQAVNSTAETEKPQETANTNATEERFIYIGPTTNTGLVENTIFTGNRETVEKYLEPTIEKLPQVRLLIVAFNCGTLVEGDTLPELAEKLFDEVIAVASGKEVKSEIAGFHDMAIFKQGVTL